MPSNSSIGCLSIPKARLAALFFCEEIFSKPSVHSLVDGWTATVIGGWLGSVCSLMSSPVTSTSLRQDLPEAELGILPEYVLVLGQMN